MGILTTQMRQPAPPAAPAAPVPAAPKPVYAPKALHNPAQNLGKYHHPKKGS